MYRPPEADRGSKPYGYGFDIWTIGACLAEILTGKWQLLQRLKGDKRTREAFYSSLATEAINWHHSDNPAGPGQHATSAIRNLVGLVKKMTRGQSSDRGCGYTNTPLGAVAAKLAVELRWRCVCLELGCEANPVGPKERAWPLA